MAVSTAAAQSSSRTGQIIAMLVMVVALCVAPFFIYPYFLMQALCFALLACAFNLLIGFVGLLSFGHAMFMGTGAYICAHLAQARGFPTEISIIGGVIAASLLGYVAGALSIRRQGIYFSMITLALSQLVYFIALEAPFTHGEDGIQPVPQGRIFGGLVDLSQPLQIYFFVLAIFLAGFLLIYRIINSPFGEVLKSIRENEPRAISLGYKVDQYKHAAFVLSASLAGLAGAVKALVVQNASLTDVHWTTSGEIVLMTLVGGMGTIFGPVVGALIVSAMQTYLSGYGQWVTVIQGVIFVTCVLAFRRGIVGEIAARLKTSL